MCKSPYGVLKTFDGLSLRYGFWPLEKGRSKGTVVVLGGRSEFMEKYLVAIEELNGRGFDVFSFDWRGQGLSGRMLADSQKGHVENYSDYVSDLDLLLNRFVHPRCRRPIIFLAHSMGAHIALRYLSKFSRSADKAVMTGPMIQIKLNPLSEMLARQCSRLMKRASKGHVGMPSMLRKDSFGRPFRYNWLTSDEDRFYAIRRMLTDNPRLKSSDVTFGWLNATFTSVDALHAQGCAENITTPSLLVMAGRDHVVCNASTGRFARRLPRHRLVKIEGAFHEILQERENYRRQFWSAFDSFIAL